MSFRLLNQICYTICIVCVAIAVVLSLMLVWDGLATETGWRGLGTVLIVFFGAAMILSVNRVMVVLQRRKDDER